MLRRGELQLLLARLARTQYFARAPQAQVFLGSVIQGQAVS